VSNPTLDSDPSAPKLPADPPREQRRYPRFELAVRCWIMDSRHTLYLRVHDISRGGLSVRAPVPFAPEGKVEVGLELPSGQRVRVRGEIVWVRSSSAVESGPRMGARFLEFVEGEEELYQLLGNA
jgi:hypothetical protein